MAYWVDKKRSVMSTLTLFVVAASHTAFFLETRRWRRDNREAELFSRYWYPLPHDSGFAFDMAEGAPPTFAELATAGR